MTKGSIMEAEKATSAQSSAHPTWNGTTAARNIEESVHQGLLKPCRALVLGADMIEEAATLSKLGFEVLVTDTSSETLSRASHAVHAQGGRSEPFTRTSSRSGSISTVRSNSSSSARCCRGFRRSVAQTGRTR